MKYFGIIFVIFEFIIEKQYAFYNKLKKCLFKLLGTLGVIGLVIYLILILISPDDSEIKNNFLVKNDMNYSVKCYQTDNGIRTDNFRLYKANEYTIINVVYDKWDIYPKDSNKNGFYLGKCDILDKSGKVIKIKE